MLKDTINLRRATREDCDLLFHWRNEKECRENSINTEEVPYETHCAWFEKRMKDDNTLIFIGMSGEECVGMVRVDVEESTGNISYSIDKKFRGRGFGRSILMELENEADIRKKIIVLQAQVKQTNLMSRSIFIKLGYEEEFLNGLYHYKKSIK